MSIVIEQSVQGVYHIVHVDGWDWESDEFAGRGRCLRTCATLAGAVEAAARLGEQADEWVGPGHVVVTDAAGGYVYSPSVPLRALRALWAEGQRVA